MQIGVTRRNPAACALPAAKRTSHDSTVHGLTGKSPILPGEDPADLLDLAESYRDSPGR